MSLSKVFPISISISYYELRDSLNGPSGKERKVTGAARKGDQCGDGRKRSGIDDERLCLFQNSSAVRGGSERAILKNKVL